MQFHTPPPTNPDWSRPDTAVDTTNASDAQDMGMSLADQTPGTDRQVALQPRIQFLQTVLLQAEVERLVAERDMLVDRLDDLKTEIQRLEFEVVALEQTIEYKDRERQQLINRYEYLLSEQRNAERDTDSTIDRKTHQSIEEENDSAPSDRSDSSFHRVTSLLRDLVG